MYQALYRKWRPKVFSDVIGQSHITETLQKQVAEGRTSHAYLFTGTRGTGKTTCAKILAKAVNCEHPVNGDPCCQCPSCVGIESGSFLDVLELDAASNNGVDQVRALRDEAIYSPANVKKRVYIVDEVHMLSTPAFNALLKILEEPPEHLMFILATTELQKVPATILSRCQRHSFKRIDTPVITEYLEYIAGQEGFTLEHDAAELIARLAEGGVRDALSLLDQCSAREKIDLEAVYSAMGLAGNRRVAELLDHILRHNTEAALKAFSGMWMDGKDPVSLLTELSNLLRDVLMLHVAPKGALELISGAFDTGTLREFAGRMTTEELLCAMNTLQRTLSTVKDAKNTRNAAELCLVSLCDSTLGESVAELRARISRLERQMEEGVPVRQEERGYIPEEYYDELPEPPRRDEEPEFEEPGPEVFIDEPRENVPAKNQGRQAEKKPEEPSAPAAAPAEKVPTWAEICSRVSDRLPAGLKTFLSRESDIRGRIEGDLLKLEANPIFVYGRVNKPEVLQLFAQAAGELAGREIRVMLSELKPNERPQRDIDELRAYPEVKFIN